VDGRASACWRHDDAPAAYDAAATNDATAAYDAADDDAASAHDGNAAHDDATRDATRNDDATGQSSCVVEGRDAIFDSRQRMKEEQVEQEVSGGVVLLFIDYFTTTQISVLGRRETSTQYLLSSM